MLETARERANRKWKAFNLPRLRSIRNQEEIYAYSNNAAEEFLIPEHFELLDMNFNHHSKMWEFTYINVQKFEASA